MRVCCEQQRYSLCNDDFEYASNLFLATLVLKLSAFQYQGFHTWPFSKNAIFWCIFTIKLVYLSNSRICLDKTGYNVSIFHKVTYCHQSIFASRILSELFCPFIFCKKLSLLTCLLWVYSFSSNLFRGITSFLGSLWTLVPIVAKNICKNKN